MKDKSLIITAIILAAAFVTIFVLGVTGIITNSINYNREEIQKNTKSIENLANRVDSLEKAFNKFSIDKRNDTLVLQIIPQNSKTLIKRK